MRRVSKLVLATALLLPVMAECQQTGANSKSESQSAVKLDWRKVWRNATVSFGEVARDPITNREFFHALGTGIIVNTDEHTAYIVTARHMFCDTEKDFHPRQLRLRLAWQDYKSTYSYLGLPLDLRTATGADLWSSLDDGSDVAAIPMLPTLFNESMPVEDRLSTYDSVSFDDIVSDPYEGESVWIFGYPVLVGNEKLVRAIVRLGTVAWTDPNKPQEKPFLVDANLYPGNSGGPVIQLPIGFQRDGSFDYLQGGRLRLLGIVSQAPSEDIKTTISTRQLGKVETHTSIDGIGAIGVIEPGSKIRKLLDLMRSHSTQPPVCDVPEPKSTQPK